MKSVAILTLCLMLLFLTGCEIIYRIGAQTTPGITTKTNLTPMPSVTSSPEAHFRRIDFDGTIVIDLDLDGSLENIGVSQNEDGTVTVEHTDGDEHFAGTIDPLYITECYIDDVTESDGYLELFVTGDMASDDYATHIYRFKDSVTEESVIYGIVKNAAGEGSLIVHETVDVFGTYGAECRYSLKDGLEFEVSSPYTVVQYEGFEERKITVIRDDLPAQAFLDGVEYEDVLLPAGTELLLIETDCKSYGLFTTEDNKIIRIAITKKPDEWGWFIDGISEEEWFDGLSYSG